MTLEDSTRQANARYFDSLDEVPTHAVTMGISTIMKSKEILLLISGEEKAETLKKLIHGDISEEFPASILKNIIVLQLSQTKKRYPEDTSLKGAKVDD